MRPIQHATEAIVWCLLAGIVGGGPKLLNDEPTLDLTAPPASEHRSLGVPGSFAGGTSDGRSIGPPEYDLPLRIEIENPQERLDPLRKRLRLQVILLNVSAQTYKLPSCVDEVKTHGHRQTDRRTFEFGFRFSGQNRKVDETAIGAVTFAAASTPECDAIILPGTRMRIILEITLPDEVRGLIKDSHQLDISAHCSEFVLENSSFQVSRQSREIASAPVSLVSNQ
jgi:hypothetical protein